MAIIVEIGMEDPNAPSCKSLAIWGVTKAMIRNAEKTILPYRAEIVHASQVIHAAYKAKGINVKKILFSVIIDCAGKVWPVTSQPLPGSCPVQGRKFGAVESSWCDIGRYVVPAKTVLRVASKFDSGSIGLLGRIMNTPGIPPPDKQYVRSAKWLNKHIENTKMKPSRNRKRASIMKTLRKSTKK